MDKSTEKIVEAFRDEMERLQLAHDMDSIKAVIFLLEEIGLSLRPLKAGDSQFEFPEGRAN